MELTSNLPCYLAAGWLLVGLSCAAAAGHQAKADAGSPAHTEARAAATAGNIAEAIQKYREAIQIAPGDKGLHLEFGQYLASAGRYPEAIGQYEEYLRLTPQKEEAELGLAEAYRCVHNQDAAMAVLKSARTHHPRSVVVLKAFGSLEIEAESYDAAIEALGRAVTIAPEDTSLQFLLATAYLGKGDKEAALAGLQRLLARKVDDLPALFMRGQIYADRNENEKALSDVEKVFASQPTNTKARKLLAKILVRLQQCERAANLLQTAGNSQLATDELFMLANAYDCAGQASAAKRAREQFATASQNDRRRAENGVQSKHLYEQANELARNNQFSQALDLLQQALEKDPENGFAYSQQAKIFFSMHETEKARAAISRALAIQPYQPDFLYVDGVIVESDGRDEEAMTAFEQVTEINPKEADAYFEIGRIFMKRNDRDRALAAFRKAVQLEPDDPDYKRALQAASYPQP